ncbi:hypothetical protein [Enterococcus casseliflavus]|uniref:hypothetical protein n=1 Tax=Enterococcus casseliflavus TaxID=37734 RepID=UPI0039A4482B
MSELKKLETTGYSSKLDEIAKNDTEVFLKVKLSGRRTFGEYEFEPKNGFAVHFGNHIDVLDLDKCDVYQLDQPQLNENQQVVLDWLKNRYTGNADPFGVAACLFSQTPRSEVIVATLKLTRDEQAQVLKIFANWTLEQVEDL